MWQIMFTDRPPRCYADDLNSDQRRTRNLDLMLRRNGHYLIPGVRKFMSSGHSDEDLDITLQALDRLLPDI